MSKVHVTENSTYSCELCEKNFDQKYLNQHLKDVHSNDRKYKCDTCGKYFNQLTYLNSHKEKLHDKVTKKEFKCTSCSKEFSRIGDLKEHYKRMHVQTRTHKCEVCDGYFPSRELKKIHFSRVHANEINDTEKCDLCTKVFNSVGGLKSHMINFHDRNKTYKCHTCERFFHTNGNLTKHIKVVHDQIRNFKCQTCSRLFSTKSNMMVHFKRKHKEVRNDKAANDEEDLNQELTSVG